MHQEAEKASQSINKQILKLQLLEMPAMLILGLGLYAKFSDGNAFHPLLNKPAIANGFIILGGLLVLWCTYQVAMLILKKVKAREAK